MVQSERVVIYHSIQYIIIFEDFSRRYNVSVLDMLEYPQHFASVMLGERAYGKEPRGISAMDSKRYRPCEITGKLLLEI
jgi:hypothetical protein